MSEPLTPPPAPPALAGAAELAADRDAALPEAALLPSGREIAELIRQRAAQVAALKALAKAGTNPPGVARAAAALRKAGDEPLGPWVDRLERWVEREPATRGERLARALKEQCLAAGVEIQPLSRDPLELRLAPFLVAVDLARDKASVQYAQTELARARAEAGEILKARQAALKRLEKRPFQPADFLRALHRAWSQVGGGGWQEIGRVLPVMAFEVQDERFRRDPTPQNFTEYGRAQLAYDLMRARRARQLAVDGLRLSLGPATGGSTRDKRQVYWLEDEQGRGQYYLTLRFVSEVADG